MAGDAGYLGFPVCPGGDQIPEGASWIVLGDPLHYFEVDNKIKVITQWHNLFREKKGKKMIVQPFDTEDKIKKIESKLLDLDVTNFYGLIFGEEIYRNHIKFDPSLNLTWFNEQLLGYDLYKKVNPNSTR